MILQRRWLSDEERWEAVCRRNDVAAGAFFYGVKTTGVYCRPNCRSRLPRRENVVFFDSIDDAERAGFRACRRCRPSGSGEARLHRNAILRACREIESSEAQPALGELAAGAGLSPHHFQRVFKRTVGVSPKQFAMGCQTNRLRHELLAESTVTRAIYAAGYGSNSRAYEGVAQRLGMKPSAYRRGGEGVTIHYATVSTDLGRVLVVATDKGVCAMEFLDSKARPASRVKALFPRAEVAEGGDVVGRYAAAVAEFIARPGAGLNLPLDIAGTAFQQRVWQALRRIPPGQTRTYKEIAAAVGSPKAVRAVGRSCATNPVALAVPCHRVVGSEGELTGYRWGKMRKRALLKREVGKNGHSSVAELPTT